MNIISLTIQLSIKCHFPVENSHAPSAHYLLDCYLVCLAFVKIISTWPPPHPISCTDKAWVRLSWYYLPW